MNIFITGATGFVGKSLKEYFEEAGHFVLAPPREEINWLNFKSFFQYWNVNFRRSEFKWDAVIHCAGLGGRRGDLDSVHLIHQNVVMAYNAHQAAKMMDCEKFFHIGSGAEHNRKKGVSNIIAPEETPEDFYGLSKLAIEAMFSGVQGACNLRAFGLFGSNEETQRFIRSALNRYKHKMPIEIHKDKRMDFFSTEDLGRVAEAVIESYPPNAFHDINLSYPERMLWLSDIAAFINTLDLHEVDVIVQSSALSRDYFGNIVTMKTVLKNCPELELLGQKESIRRLYECL